MLRDILNTLWIKIISAIIALCILILTTLYLGADGRGMLSLISTSVGTIGLFAGFVGGPAIIYLGTREKLEYLLPPIYGWTMVVVGVGSVFLWYFHIIPPIYILSVAILSILYSLYVTNYYILTGHQKIRDNNKIYLFQWIVYLIFLIIFFLLLAKPYVEYAVTANFMAYVCCLALTFSQVIPIIKISSITPKKQIPAIKSLISFSFLAQAAAVMCYLDFRFGTFILKIFSNLFEVGIYSVGINLADFILLASQSIALVSYSRISNSKNPEYAREITIKLTKFGFLLTLFITVILLLLPAAIYEMIFGGDFTTVPNVLLSMGPGIIAFGGSIIIFNFFAGIGKNRINAYAALIGFLANIFFCFLLIPGYGLYGAGIAVSISLILMSVVLIWEFLSETNTRFNELILRREDIRYLYLKFRDLIGQNN